MLSDLCQELKNWFEYDKVFKVFTIKDGIITPSLNLKEGQYFRIIGSVLNDGIYKYGTDEDQLTDEIFDGAIWLMAIPKNVVELDKKINEYEESSGFPSPFVSESFGGYSYTKKSDASWKTEFKNELNRWRKI